MERKTKKFGERRNAKKARIRGIVRTGQKTIASPKNVGNDLEVTFPSGTKWIVEVKPVRSKAEGKDLTLRKQVSQYKKGVERTLGSKATHVIAHVTPKGIKYTSAKTGREIKPPTQVGGESNE